MVSVDCLQRAAMKHQANKGDNAELKNAMLKLINQRQQHHYKQLSMLQQIFHFESEESPRLIDLVKEQLLLGNFSWSAKIRLTIVEARGLMPKDNNGLSDPYCLVQVGKNIKRTGTRKRTLAPIWNENFEFKVDSARESIKIRLWDEDDDLRARLKGKWISNELHLTRYINKGEFHIWAIRSAIFILGFRTYCLNHVSDNIIRPG